MHTSDFQNNEEEFVFKGSSKTPKGFKIPEGYLDDFEKSMLAKISLEEPEPIVVTAIKPIKIQKIISVLTIAACLIWAAFVWLSPEKEMKVNQRTYTEGIIESYDDYYLIDEYVLAENLSMEELENMTFDEILVSEDEIYEYVLEMNYSEFVILENI